MKKLILILLVFASCMHMAWAQSKNIKGTVTSADDGSPLVGVTVVVKGTTLGTVTNIDGNYQLNVPESAESLEFSFVGMLPSSVPISGNTIDAVLREEAVSFNEVMIVAYGVSTREAVTGAIASIDAKAIDNRPVSNVAGALEGSTPGVQVNNSYGEPGSEPTVRVRGFSSVNGSNSPLYVVDGVPYSGNISDLNPQDIESMTVLKDAASAALYGNRASNGVILITTKKGKDGKMRIDASANFGSYTRGIKDFDRMDADQWMETTWEGYRNSRISEGATMQDANEFASNNLIANVVQRNVYNKADNELFDGNGKLVSDAYILPGYDDLDWNDYVERRGSRQDYNISADASSDKYNFYSSLSYLKEDGYIITSNFERFTGRLNGNFTPNKWFKTGFNMNATSANSNYSASADGTSYSNPFYRTRVLAPVYPVFLHNEDGSYALDESGNKQYDATSNYLNGRNLVYELENDFNKKSRDVIKGQAYATFSFLKDFKFTARADKNIRNQHNRQYDNPTIGDGAGSNGRLYNYYYRYDEYTLQQQLFWQRTFNKHFVDVLAGHENYSYNRSYNTTAKTDMKIPGIVENSNFSNQTNSEGYTDKYRTESYLARARYNYDGKYYLDASFRRDGSSRFHPDNRWGNFYSFGASWNMEKEQFLQDVNWVDYLKLRASYGEVGNDAGVGYYGYQSQYVIDQNGGMGAYTLSNVGNPDIQWETTSTIDIAVEGRLFDKLNFSIDYFDKRSRDLLFDVVYPLSNGATTDEANGAVITDNIGTLSNRGLEVALDFDIIRNNNWYWNLGVEATFLKNELIELPDGEDIISGNYRYTEGRSIYEFWTFQYEGVDQLTGDALYKIDTDAYYAAGQTGGGSTEIPDEWVREINGEYYTTNTTYGERDYSGSALPDVYGSINSSLSYKSLSLDMLFTYSIGGKLYDSSYRTLMSVTEDPNAIHSDLAGAWHEAPNGITASSENRIDPNGIPRIDMSTSLYSNAMSDRFLHSASYFAIKNIALRYQLPRTWINTIGLNNLALRASVENLVTFTSLQGLNPQYNFSGGSDYTFTTPRVFTFGVDISL